MLVMAIDTALAHCSVAIFDNGAERAVISIPLERGHAEALAPMVVEALEMACVPPRSLDRVGVVVGPGSFAGVRVGLSFARAMRIGTAIEVIGISSLRALAANATPPILQADPQGVLAALIDARRGHLYAALFDASGEPIVAPMIAPADGTIKKLQKAADGRQIYAVGDGAAMVDDLETDWRLPDAPVSIDPRVLAKLIASAPRPEGPPRPLYLRPPDAKAAKPGKYDELTNRSEPR